MCYGPHDVVYEIINPKYNVLNFIQRVITGSEFRDISMALWIIGNICGENHVAAKHILENVTIID